MKTTKYFSLSIALAGLLLLSNAQAGVPSYESLHPVIKYTLYEKNGQRPVTDEILRKLLPVEYLNMRQFDQETNLDIIESTPDLKTLVLSPFVEDFSKLQTLELSNLTYLNASFSFINEEHLAQAQFPALETIDISASRVRSLDFLNQMPQIRRVILVRHQICQEEIQEMKQKFPYVAFEYNSNVPPISRHFYFFEFKPYLDVLSAYLAAVRRSGFEMNVEMEVNAGGQVVSSRLMHPVRRLEKDPLSIFDLLIFAPDENPHKSNIVVQIPIEVTG